MAQKNYAQMPTKKLNALLETVTDESEKAAIEKVLAKRGQLNHFNSFMLRRFRLRIIPVVFFSRHAFR